MRVFYVMSGATWSYRLQGYQPCLTVFTYQPCSRRPSSQASQVWALHTQAVVYNRSVYYCTACAFISLLNTIYNHLRDASMAPPFVHGLVAQVRLQSSILLNHSCMYRSIGYGLQSFKRWVCCRTACAFISLLSMVYNHPKDAPIAVLLLQVLVHRVRFTIIHGIRLRLHSLCIHQSIGYDLQSSMGCVYGCTACAYIGPSDTV